MVRVARELLGVRAGQRRDGSSGGARGARRVPRSGLFGAKITGGGSGGTVAILGTDAAESAVHDIARRVRARDGVAAFVFDGSGPGADEWECRHSEASGNSDGEGTKSAGVVGLRAWSRA